MNIMKRLLGRNIDDRFKAIDDIKNVTESKLSKRRAKQKEVLDEINVGITKRSNNGRAGIGKGIFGDSIFGVNHGR